MTSGTVWRRATPADLPALNRLLEAFGRTATDRDLPPGDTTQVWVTEAGTAMFVLYFVRDTGRWTGHFTSMVVAPEARGQGLGKQMVELAGEQARRFADAEDCRLRVFGYTNPAREATIHILEETGWQRLSDGAATSLWAFDV